MHMLYAFKKAVTAYTSTQLRREHAAYFQSLASKRLNSLGVCSVTPALRAEPRWEAQRRLAVDRAVISLRKDVTQAAAQRWEPGQRMFVAAPLDSKLPVPWVFPGVSTLEGQGTSDGVQRQAGYVFLLPS